MSLNDKILEHGYTEETIAVKDVKESIRNLKNKCFWCKGKGKFLNDADQKITVCTDCKEIDEEFGKGLLE